MKSFYQLSEEQQHSATARIPIPTCKRCGGRRFLCNGIGEGLCDCPDCKVLALAIAEKCWYPSKDDIIIPGIA